MIRSQQTQLQQLQQQNQSQNPQSSGTAVSDDATPASERSTFFFPVMPPPATSSNRPSISMSNRRSSRPSSQTASPNLQPQDATRRSEGTETYTVPRESSSRRGSRDESAYYQAEAAMLSRENQMLRQRIRELGRSCSAAFQLYSCSPTENPTPKVGWESLLDIHADSSQNDRLVT